MRSSPSACRTERGRSPELPGPAPAGRRPSFLTVTPRLRLCYDHENAARPVPLAIQPPGRARCPGSELFGRGADPDADHRRVLRRDLPVVLHRQAADGERPRLAGRPATVRWHPFELNPDMPREGVERRAYRVKKFGSWERSLELDAQVGRAVRRRGARVQPRQDGPHPEHVRRAPGHLARRRAGRAGRGGGGAVPGRTSPTAATCPTGRRSRRWRSRAGSTRGGERAAGGRPRCGGGPRVGAEGASGSASRACRSSS